MEGVLDALARHAAERPEATALEGGGTSLGYAELAREVERFAAMLRDRGARVVALMADNGPAWAVADLAILAAGAVALPLPPFFADGQIAHALEAAGADALLSDTPERFIRLRHWRPDSQRTVGGRLLALLRHPQPNRVTPPLGSAKITFTSGTTGTPKGVCLDQPTLEAVAHSLVAASTASADDRHLTVLPLATLLENVGGLYAPLLAGATVVLPPQEKVGMSGSGGFAPMQLLDALDRHRATSAILVPALLQGLVAVLRGGAPRPRSLRYLAVGGASVAPRLVEEAERLGLPVYQGYGLSECASVVAVNTPEANRPGSVGHPLPHARVEIADDGEILVGGPRLLGYLGESAAANPPLLATGDLGRFDEEGFLHITGRKKNVFINAFGRNLSPEWVEAELTAHPAIPQAALFGEARPWNCAVIFSPADDGAVASAIDAANAALPDYARVRHWLRAATPFTVANGLATANGRPRREAILAAHHQQIERLYQEANQEKRA